MPLSLFFLFATLGHSGILFEVSGELSVCSQLKCINLVRFILGTIVILRAFFWGAALGNSWPQANGWGESSKSDINMTVTILFCHYMQLQVKDSFVTTTQLGQLVVFVCVCGLFFVFVFCSFAFI